MVNSNIVKRGNKISKLAVRWTKERGRGEQEVVGACRFRWNSRARRVQADLGLLVQLSPFSGVWSFYSVVQRTVGTEEQICTSQLWTPWAGYLVSGDEALSWRTLTGLCIYTFSFLGFIWYGRGLEPLGKKLQLRSKRFFIIILGKKSEFRLFSQNSGFNLRTKIRKKYLKVRILWKKSNSDFLSPQNSAWNLRKIIKNNIQNRIMRKKSEFREKSRTFLLRIIMSKI